MVKKDYICSFCNRKQAEVKKLIVGPNVYICDFCTNICGQILQEDDCINNKIEEHNNEIKNFTPEEIYTRLDEVVASQDEAKKQLSLAAYLHYLSIKNREEKSDNDIIKITKNNLLLIGPTGSGKTLLVQTLGTILDLPCVIIDANGLTEAGYVGDDAESIVKKLFLSIYNEGDNIQECVQRVENGIICIDEIDKKHSVEGPHNRDVSGKGVQQNLLRIIEGTDIHITLDHKKYQEPIVINTKNILFITMGAFEGLDKIIWKHVKQTTGLGVISNNKDTNPDSYNNLIPFFKREHLVDFGIIKELLGRLHTIVFCQKLSEEDLVSILCKKKNNIMDEYRYLLKMHNVQLIYEDNIMSKIAKFALKDNMGARSLRSIMHSIFFKVLFDLPSLHKKNENKKYMLKLVKNEENQIITLLEEIINNQEVENNYTSLKTNNK